MKQKGFTLVELLAVIVILAVIALIATPQVLSMIESSRQGAAESSMLSYVDVVEKSIVVKLMNASNDTNYSQPYEIKGLELTNRISGVTQMPCKNKSTGALEAYGDVPNQKCSSTQNVNTNYLSFRIDIKGDQPAAGVTNTVTVSRNIVTEAQIKFNKYYVSYYYDATSGKTTYCSGDSKFYTLAECNSLKS